MNAEDGKGAWFDKLTMSAHPEPVEGCVLCVLCVHRPAPRRSDRVVVVRSFTSLAIKTNRALRCT